MPPTITSKLRTLWRLNRALQRTDWTANPHFRVAATEVGHYDHGIDDECVRWFRLKPADVKHLMADFTPAARERVRLSVAGAAWYGKPLLGLSKDGPTVDVVIPGIPNVPVPYPA